LSFTRDVAARSGPNPLTDAAREELIQAKRPQRALPVLTSGKRHLPLADQVRSVDTRARPLYAVWEVTLRCDLACRHCGSRAGSRAPTN
jgi:hypothetical protein